MCVCVCVGVGGGGGGGVWWVSVCVCACMHMHTHVCVCVCVSVWCRWYFAMQSISGIFSVTFSVVFAFVADVTTDEDRSSAYGLVSWAWCLWTLCYVYLLSSCVRCLILSSMLFSRATDWNFILLTCTVTKCYLDSNTTVIQNWTVFCSISVCVCVCMCVSACIEL